MSGLLFWRKTSYTSLCNFRCVHFILIKKVIPIFVHKLNLEALQHLNLSDADDCRRICEHGAKKLGYGSYQHYALRNYDLDSDSGSDSEWLSAKKALHEFGDKDSRESVFWNDRPLSYQSMKFSRAFLHNMNHLKFLWRFLHTYFLFSNVKIFLNTLLSRISIHVTDKHLA